MIREKYVTKEYFDKRFHEFEADMHTALEVVVGNAKSYFTLECQRYVGALQEGFSEKVQISLDQIRALTEKSENHEERICKIEKAVI